MSEIKGINFIQGYLIINIVLIFYIKIIYLKI